MQLDEARSILKETHSHGYSYMLAWGLSLIREAIRTVRNRKSATESDRMMADITAAKIYNKQNETHTEQGE